MRRSIIGAALLMLLGMTLRSISAGAQESRLQAELLAGFRFRPIGPAVTGGRIHDIEVPPGDASTIYIASASGGLWKSVNRGTTWTPIFDQQPVSTFGDLAISPSNPGVLWAGTGEQNNRQSTSWGGGVFRSTDAGTTWTHVGLAETRHIGRIVVHPTNPDLAYVAALGNLWRPSAERGIFQTTDGGRNWTKVLYVDSLTGFVDLVMDPADPNTLVAAAYQRLRRAWGFNGGGPGSGIFKTTDGGRTWRRIQAGIPPGDIGRIGLAVAVGNGQVMNATIEHRGSGGTYRSVDGGESWRKVADLNPRPMYYSHIWIDPRSENRVYVLGTQSYVSEDGGATFRALPTAPTYDVGVHADHHALWIDPADTRHLLLGGDGGLYETWDRGVTFNKINNFVIAQFYDIGLDMRQPYWVYGGLQDNHSWMGPSATRHWEGIINDDWRQIGFGDGMYHQPDPTTHRYIYSNSNDGGFTRVDAETGDILDITPIPPAGEPPYRWEWNSPTLVSRHDPAMVYAGGNRLFISRDRGVSWERTDDLSRRIDRDTLRLMGVQGSEITLSRYDGESSFGAISSIAESPLDPAILWVGTDDGNLQVSRDGGRTWSEVGQNIAGAPPGAFVSRVVASRAGLGGAYAAYDAHRDGDFAPYVYHTADFGRTWTSRGGGLPTGSVNVIAEHHANPQLLFLGSEHGLFVSGDAGASWVRFMPNLPTTLFDDIEIHPRDNDLVIGTHGRGIWILDDLSPLVEWSRAVANQPAHLFTIRPATIFQFWKDQSYRGQGAYAGENPPFGAMVSYYLAQPARRVTISVQDAGGRVIRQLEGPGVPGTIHRLTWDLRHEPPPQVGGAGGGDGASQALPALAQPVGPRGPLVSPGTYGVILRAGESTARTSVVVRGDPHMPVTDEQHREREAFLLEVAALQRRGGDVAQRLGIRLQGGGFGAPPPIPVGDSLAAARARLAAAVRGLASLAADMNGGGVRQGSLYPPTRTQQRRKQELEGMLNQALTLLEGGGARR
ncbi:MAG TPA: hypothetical protein VD793_01900 [Gemmatimonadales bacterium]|nr:hypothetical protein [Gemmatimonadales bacterium]